MPTADGLRCFCSQAGCERLNLRLLFSGLRLELLHLDRARARLILRGCKSKFVNDDSHQRSSRNCKKQTQQAKQFGSGQGKKQNVHRVQSHFFPSTPGTSTFKFDLVDQNDYA